MMERKFLEVSGGREERAVDGGVGYVDIGRSIFLDCT